MSFRKTTPLLRIFDEGKAPPWGTRDMSVKDPFGNRLTFTTSIGT